MTAPVQSSSAPLTPWSIDEQTLLQHLETTSNGIDRQEASVRLKQNESFRLKPHRATAWSLLWDQFKSPIVILLIASAMLSYFLDSATDSYMILTILLAGIVLSFWQELSASNAVARLLAVIKTRATVIRDGQDLDVFVEEIVPGDVIRLRAGDMIPGDCRLLESRDLYVNESALTGESFPAEKSVSVLPEKTPLAQRTNSVFLGTHVISGQAKAVVIATGRETEFGRISSRLETRPPETGFERGLRNYGGLLIKVVVLFTIAVFAVHVMQHKPVIESLLFGLSLAVGMTPQLLPAVTSVVMAAGAKSMARVQVIVKQLIAIENLGSMNVLCSDKTGTLTDARIQLHSAQDLNGQSSDRVFHYALCNAAFQSGFENPIDRAICASGKIELNDIQKLDELPYDFVRKRLSILIRERGQNLIVTKGALSHVLECCTTVETPSGEQVGLDTVRDSIQQRFLDLSQEGYRVLGLALKRTPDIHVHRPDESDMSFIGFLVFFDPPKADAADTLRQLRDLGVSLKMITGDNHAVAASVSRRVGILNARILTGTAMTMMSDEALKRQVHDVDVFAEVEPNQKERIILALKHSGHVVGYMGDGINDVSALHAADVGISVASAVDVAREAAQVVLLKHDLNVVVHGVEEGRKTFANTLKYIFFSISANFGYMFSLAMASLFLDFLPLLPAQILLVNLLADFPAMALATDSVDPESIRRPRRWDARFIGRFMLIFGFSSSTFDFLTFGTLLFLFHANQAEFRTGWFVESVLTGLMIMAIIRTQRPFLLSRPGTLFLIACAGVTCVTLWLPYSRFSQSLEFVAPSNALMAMAIVITILYGLGLETVKILFYRYIANQGSAANGVGQHG